MFAMLEYVFVLRKCMYVCESQTHVSTWLYASQASYFIFLPFQKKIFKYSLRNQFVSFISHMANNNILAKKFVFYAISLRNIHTHKFYINFCFSPLVFQQKRATNIKKICCHTFDIVCTANRVAKGKKNYEEIAIHRKSHSHKKVKVLSN